MIVPTTKHFEGPSSRRILGIYRRNNYGVTYYKDFFGKYHWLVGGNLGAMSGLLGKQNFPGMSEDGNAARSFGAMQLLGNSLDYETIPRWNAYGRLPVEQQLKSQNYKKKALYSGLFKSNSKIFIGTRLLTIMKNPTIAKGADFHISYLFLITSTALNRALISCIF